MSSTVDRLFVLWSHPETRSRFTVGELWRADGVYGFAYGAEVEAALRKGFDLLPQFPTLRRADDPYASRSLFSTFAQRVPSPRREDYGDIVRGWGLPSSERDPFTLLAASGGVQLTDRLEVAEYRSPTDELLVPLEFRVAGTEFYGNEASARVGDRVHLRAEVNPHDPAATVVLLKGDLKLGYVPRYYSALVSRLLENDTRIDAVLERRLVLPDERGRWIVRLTQAASSALAAPQTDPMRIDTRREDLTAALAAAFRPLLKPTIVR